MYLFVKNKKWPGLAIWPLHQCADVPICNNTGKTSLINALQFLLIVDKRRMDFGAHDVEKSRRFYFPNNSAFILLDARLARQPRPPEAK